MGIDPINPVAIQKAVKASSAKGLTKDFNAFLGAADAMAPATMTGAQMYSGNVNASTVLASAFSGIGQLNSLTAPSFAAGAGVGYNGSPIAGYGSLKYSGQAMTGAAAGTGDGSLFGTNTGFSQMDMVNTMNQNNLQLLELQAVMQSNMQAWNTKSNILSADHRARMAMIEKFTAR